MVNKFEKVRQENESTRKSLQQSKHKISWSKVMSIAIIVYQISLKMVLIDFSFANCRQLLYNNFKFIEHFFNILEK